MSNKKIKYLDPKNDLTFRKIFGEHPHLLISLLNSLLPLEDDQLIMSIEYLDAEIIPELPVLKRSIVDVRCKDNHDRQFIVEMQMYWTSAFKQRMLFNAGKAYVKQLKYGGKYSNLKPVFGLSLVDDIIHPQESMKDEYYHHYRFVHTINSELQIKGLELVFVELPKFKTTNFAEKRLRRLWLQFLTMIDENTESIPIDLQNEALIKEALECVQKDAFTEEELLHYEQYWDAIRIEKAALEEALEKLEAAEKREEEERRQKEEERRQKEEERRQKEDECRQKEEERRQKEEERRQKEDERRQKEIALEKIKAFVIKLNNKGSTIPEISENTGLSESEVKIFLGEI